MFEVLPEDILLFISTLLKARDLIKLSVVSKYLHNSLKTKCVQWRTDRQSTIHSYNIYAFLLKAHWVLNVSDFCDKPSDYTRLDITNNAKQVRIYIDSYDESALELLCHAVCVNFPSPREIYIRADRGYETVFKDHMLECIAKSAEVVTLCSCTSITNHGILKLINCKHLMIIHCPQLTYVSVQDLVYNHALLVLEQYPMDEVTKTWLSLQHQNCILLVNDWKIPEQDHVDASLVLD